MNKNYIAANLCENKSKPEMKCNGKCYMKKQLKSNDENQNKFPFGVKEFQEIIFFYSHSDTNIINYNDFSDISFTRFIIPKFTSPFFSIFHPPQTV